VGPVVMFSRAEETHVSMQPMATTFLSPSQDVAK
jgi:hypothetical protein